MYSGAQPESHARVSTVEYDHFESDDVLVSRIREGDRSAFTELFKKYQRPLVNFCLRFTYREAIAEEVVQEAFLKAYRGINSFRGDAKFSTWLFQIAKNLCINLHRSQLKKGEAFIEDLKAGNAEMPTQIDGAEEIIDSTTPEMIAIVAQTKEFLDEAMGKLRPGYAEALLAYEGGNHDYAEVAEALGVPIGTLKSRIHRARTKLEKALDAYDQRSVDEAAQYA